MNRMNRIFTPGINDHGVDIRNPSTANFFIDSTNRSLPTNPNAQLSNDFIISAGQSLLNGFFTRLAMTEIVLTWGIPNISGSAGNNEFIISYNDTPYTVSLTSGFYTAKLALDTIVNLLNTAAIGLTFSIVQSQAATVLTGTDIFQIFPNTLAFQLGIQTLVSSNLQPIINTPVILNTKYLDFVSNQITNNQKIKDSTTDTNTTKDVIYRWNFAWDNVPTLYDNYNFPIYQGYTAFISRRYLSFPKQINWQPNQPIGILNFQVYQDDGELLIIPFPNGIMEYTLNLLVSEI